MPYFPFFMNICGKSVLVAGGGNVALRKVEKLLPFGAKITVVAPKICSQLLELSAAHSDYIDIHMRKFETADIDGRFCVISATDSEPLNAEIYRLCSLRNILVNTVDDKEKCSFIFPALSVADDITIGISTSGKSPIYAKFLRERTDSLLSGKTLAAAEILADYRPVIKREFAGEDERKEVNAALLNLCLCGDTLPNDNEINELIGRMKENYDKENQNRNEEIKACNGTDRPCG